MIGGFKVKKYFKNRYSLTEQGAKNLTRATLYCFLTCAINIAPMLVLMAVLNQLILGHSNNVWTYVTISVLTLLTLYSLLSSEYTSLYDTTYKESANLRIRISKDLVDIPLHYFSKHDLSDLSQTIMMDVADVEHAMSHSIPKVMGMLLFFPFLGFLLIMSNWKLGIAVILPTLLSFLVVPLSRKQKISQNKKYHTILRENSELFQETIELHNEICSFNKADSLKRDLYKKMVESEKVHFKLESSSFLILGISSISSYVSVIAVVLIGINLYINNEITLLYLIGYIICSLKVKELFDISKEGIMEMMYIEPSLNRIKAMKAEVVKDGNDVELNKYDIRFKNVSFGYNDDRKVLKDISFEARQGEVTAIIGESGSGKTSILRLVSRLYDYDGGSIIIDGNDIKTISSDSLYKNISIVFQDVVLFNTNILENIRLGRDGATDEEVKNAAKLANCMDFIEKLPNGFYTNIGENGAELSGGERQRLSIARAFLKNSPILLLDEISTSLDIDNEKKIQDSLKKLIKDKTVIIISHRLKSIENADKIVVIDNGYVENEGTHSQLLKTSKVYRNLVDKARLAEEFVY